MISIRRGYGLFLVAVILAASGGGAPRAHAAQAAAASPAVKPWEPEQDCRWWLSREGEERHRGSIGPGDTGVILSLSDPVFVPWSDSEDHKIELLFNGNTRRRVKALAYITHGPPDAVDAMFSVELDRAALRKMAGATRVEVRRGGQSVFTLDLAGTPSRAALHACIPDPNRGHGCAES